MIINNPSNNTMKKKTQIHDLDLSFFVHIIFYFIKAAVDFQIV